MYYATINNLIVLLRYFNVNKHLTWPGSDLGVLLLTEKLYMHVEAKLNVKMMN